MSEGSDTQLSPMRLSDNLLKDRLSMLANDPNLVCLDKTGKVHDKTSVCDEQE